MNRTTLNIALTPLLALALGTPATRAQDRSLYQQTEYQGREIGNLTGDVYYARQDDYLSVFMVTSDGIVLVEPVGTDMANWLKGELAARFDVPVKYVIYSHYHWDHGSGGAVWTDTARLVGHESMLGALEMPPEGTPLPENARGDDANGDGRLERGEASGNVQRLFDLYDADGDGVLTGAEVTRGPLAHVVPPDLTYTDTVYINLGGKRVEVIPIPTRHAPDNTVVRFVDGTNVVFASDWITVNRTPFGFDVARDDEIEKVRQVEAMDFEHFICSHGQLGTKADVTANRIYRETVRDRVREAIADGRSLEETQATVTMDDYSDWEFFPQQSPLNVTGAYRAFTENP